MSETLEKLLDTAEADIRLRGYHAVSFRDLAGALGIKSASVHYYFRQKEDLGIALVKRYSARFFELLETRAAEAPTEPLQAFANVYRDALVTSDRICLCGMLGAESCGLPTALAAEVSAFFTANIDWVAKALPGTPPQRQRKAEHIVATLQGAMMLAGNLKDHKVFDRAAQDLMA